MEPGTRKSISLISARRAAHVTIPVRNGQRVQALRA